MSSKKTNKKALAITKAFSKIIHDNKKEMEIEFNNLDSEKDKLLRNFCKGKITAFEEMEDFIKLVHTLLK